jgi:ABC-2 type transport system ATP-binding protein
MASSEVVLEVRDLHKTFRLGFMRRRVDAVRGVSFEVQRGEIFGFVGPNGAGKTTSIKMMLQLIFPSSGQVKLFGTSTYDPNARRRLGYLPENPYIYTYLKPLEFLDLCGQLVSMGKAERRRRAEALVHKLGIAHALDRPIGRFSKGMLQRLGFCQALLHEPELLILDEPFSGLDPIGRKDIRDLLLEEKAKGRTLLLTSHVLSDVELLSERVAVLRQGKVVAYGALDDLLRPEVRRVEIELSHVQPELRAKLDRAAMQVRELAGGDADGGLAPEQIVVAVVEGDEGVPELLRLSLDGGARVLAVTPHRETLEDLFVRKAVSDGT